VKEIISSTYMLMITTILLLITNGFAQISGIVKDYTTSEPVANVRITLQATNIHTITGQDGMFDLADATGSNLVIVAALKGYFHGSITVSSPETNAVIIIEAVPQENDSSYDFMDPGYGPMGCGMCHPDQYDQWNESPMALAGQNTWVYDIYNGTGSSGGMGGFVYTRDSQYATENPESECASCHQPEPWINEPFTPLEDINNLSTGSIHGISCETCHKVADLDESKPNYPGMYPGAVTITRPSSTSSQVQYGVLGDVSYSVPTMMRASYQPQLSAVLCSACHQDKNDPDNDGNFEEENGVISEPTYLEWLNSPYSDISSPFFATCVDCHMPATEANTFCNISPVDRDPETIRSHRMEGTTPFFLENAVELNMDIQEQNNIVNVEVQIMNNQTGHHVPTGVTIRNMILLIEAWKEIDNMPLVFLGDQIVHDLGGVGDPNQGYYAGLPGKYYGKVNHDANGNGPTFYTDATGITFDNRIPALETDTTQFTFQSPINSDYRIRARLIYRRSFRFLTDAKSWTTDGHGNDLEDMLPPYYGHLMEEDEWASNSESIVGDVNGDGDVNILDIVQLANMILSGNYEDNADLNNDGVINILDIVALVNIILSR
jgi:hypothetical protein